MEIEAEEAGDAPGARRRRWTSFFSSAAVGLPMLVFVLGVMTGFPIAIFGFDFLIANADFSSVPNASVPAPFAPHPILPVQPTRLVGADFSLADMQGARFGNVQAISANFDGAAIFHADFSGALLLAATFRNSILYRTEFAGADLTKADFDGAVVFEPDFLEGVAAGAVAGSFDPTHYRLDAIPDQAMTTHPNLNALARLAAEVQNTQPPLRLVRIAPIEAPVEPGGS